MSLESKAPRSIYAGRLSEFPDFAFTDRQVIALRGNWRDYFRQRVGSRFDGRMILEIGCADALFLSAIAAKFPSSAFIGLDWKFKAVHDAAVRVESQKLRNLALIRGRAQDILKCFGEKELDEIWIFHPEPCEREAERQNRLICQRFLLDLHTTLRTSGAAVCVKTDHADYFQSLITVAQRAAVRDRFEVAVVSANFWNDRAALSDTDSRLFAQQPTAFEKRFLRRNRPIYYFELRNHP